MEEEGTNGFVDLLPFACDGRHVRVSIYWAVLCKGLRTLADENVVGCVARGFRDVKDRTHTRT